MGAGVTLLIIGLVMGYLLRYRSVEAVEQLVNNLSGGQYKLTATSFRFNLFKFQINARNIHVEPSADNDDNSLFEFKADSLSIQVNNPIQLLLFQTAVSKQAHTEISLPGIKTISKRYYQGKNITPPSY